LGATDIEPSPGRAPLPEGFILRNQMVTPWSIIVHLRRHEGSKP
jgi:hypothetical protein